MSTLELTGLLPMLGDLTPAAAARWIEASLAQAAALREYDDCLFPHDVARNDAAERLHRAWSDWAADAEILLQYVEARGLHPAATGALRDVLGRAQAISKLGPALVAERRARAGNGKAFTLEEIRRELQLCDRC